MLEIIDGDYIDSCLPISNSNRLRGGRLDLQDTRDERGITPITWFKFNLPRFSPALSTFPPPHLHCVQCHADCAVKNRDNSYCMPHGDMQLQHARPHSQAHQGLSILRPGSPWLRFLSLSDTEKKIRNLVLYISKPNYVSSPHSPHSLKASYPIHTCMHAYTHTYAYSLSHSRLSAVSTTKHRFHELGRPRDRAARRPTGLVVDRLPH